MRRILLCLLLLVISVAGWCGETWQLTVLHTNDLHGWMLPFDYLDSNKQFPAYETREPKYMRADVGGMARRATAIARIRKATDHTVVCVDAGDVFNRGPWCTKFFGAPEVEVLNQLDYELACVGNNEFKATEGVDSQSKLLQLVRQSRFPWLAANLTVGETGVPVAGIQPFIVRRYGAVRVGFLGLTAPRSNEYPQVKGWTISDPIAAAKQWVPIARGECDILLAVTHIGVDLDEQLAAQVPGIDAIIGGDSHTFIDTPLRVKNPQGIEVPIVQAGAYGVMLGRLDMTFEHTDTWQLKEATDLLIPVDSTIPEDATIKAILDRWLAPAPAKVGELRQPAWETAYAA